MISIQVSLMFPNGERANCGEIICEEPDYRGYIYGEFRYLPEYLNHSSAFPLDPVSLPLKESIFKSVRPTGVAGVFEDSLPDAWGRKLLVKKNKLPRNRQNVPGLLTALGNNGLGALSYTESKATTLVENCASFLELELLLDAAEKFETGEFSDSYEITALLKAGSSPGGARPKVLVQDNADELWIAKFPSVQDNYAIVPIEYASMRIAQKAGIEIPKIKMINCGDRKVLLVKRFDVSAENGRYHMLSFQTLLKADNWYNLSYRDLGAVIRKYSFRPETDISSLYRQMVFNAYIGNTDDHLKNFLMLHTEQGFCLSPAYDLLPDVNDAGNHVLNFEFDPLFPGKSLLIKIGKKSFGVSCPEKIHDEVACALKNWKDEFIEACVPENQIKRLAGNIEPHFSA